MKYLLSLILFIIPIFGLSAHPHMLLFSRCRLEINDSQVEGVWVELEFDRFFGAEIIWGYDEDRNGIFDESETDNLYQGAFLSLRDYNFFTFIRVGEERILPDSVESFSARCEGPEILFYQFFVPLKNFTARDFYIAIYDATFFCSAKYQEDYFDAENGEGLDIQYGLESNPEFPVHYNPAGKMNDKTIYDKWTPGLQTFIPEEIHVTY